MPKLRPLIVGVLACLALAAPLTVVTASASAASKPNAVTVKTFRFRPGTLHVAAGSKVTWTNRDSIEHTVTSVDGAPQAFNGRLNGAGKKFRVRFDAPGTYEYFCSRHTSMHGTVVVR